MFWKEVQRTARASQGEGPWLSLGKLPRVAMTVQELAMGLALGGVTLSHVSSLPVPFRDCKLGLRSPVVRV